MMIEAIETLKSAEQLAREEVVRQTLEAVAQRLLRENCNATYKQALVRAVKIVRSMKP